MGFLKVAVVVMGILIIAGTGLLIVSIFNRDLVARISAHRAAPPPAAIDVVLDQPTGTRIGGIAAVSERLAVLLQGAGPDRIVLIDPRTGAASGTVTLAH
jgi:hypothetical protein